MNPNPYLTHEISGFVPKPTLPVAHARDWEHGMYERRLEYPEQYRKVYFYRGRTIILLLFALMLAIWDLHYIRPIEKAVC